MSNTETKSEVYRDIHLTSDGLFTSSLFNDTISIALEDEDMLARFHNENTIYLYCTVDREMAKNLTNGKMEYCIPLTLYEGAIIAREITPNSNNLVTLRVAVYIGFDKDKFYYDEFRMGTEFMGAVYSLLKKQGKAIRNISEYKAICAYTRTLSRMKQNNTTTKMPIIEYTVNDPRLLRNAQII